MRITCFPEIDMKLLEKILLKIYGEKIYREILFRKKMPVNEYQLLVENGLYPVCPRCQRTIERDYQSFCDRCGQYLEWLD